MCKTVIVYASKHHGNTYKLAEAISKKYQIDFGKFYPSVERFLEENLPKNKKVFFLYTCAKKNPKFTEHMKIEALERDAMIMGEYGCRGYNTYGPWKVIGGMNKNHPSQDELEEAIRFYENLLCDFMCKEVEE